MKTEIKNILDYIECGQEQEILYLREQISSLEAADSATLQNAIDYFHDLANQIKTQNQKYLGYYYLFLGCVYQEKGDHINAALNLQKALPELWGSATNKTLARLLLSLSYLHMEEYSKARGELQEAQKNLETNIYINSRNSYKQSQQKLLIQNMINDALANPKISVKAHFLSPTKFAKQIKEKLTPSNPPAPESTPYVSYVEPETKDIEPPSSDKRHTITIPIDANAFEKMQIDSKCITTDVAKKLQDFTE